MTTWDLNIRTETDWHIGLGAGRAGLVDRLIRRDHRDLPFVPAKTVLGILRDNATIAADALDSHDRPANHGGWGAWVEVIFGSRPGFGEYTSALPAAGVSGAPRPGALGLGPALLPQGLADRVAAHPALAAALTTNRPGVKIDRDSGVAEDKFFRQVEVARAGLTLSTTIRLDDDQWAPEQRDTAAALLAVTLRLADRLGGKRRRGLGRVTMTAPLLDVDSHREQLQAEPAPPPPLANDVPRPDPQQAPTREPDGQPAAGTPGSAWQSWEVTIRLDSPVCVSERVVGNNVVAHRSIPGSVMLPAVATELRRSIPGGAIDYLISAGHLIVGEATPEIDGQRSEPIPFGLYANRRAGPSGQSERSASNTIAGSMSTDEGPRKEMRRGFVAGSGSQLRLDEVGLVESSHNVIDEATQRPVSAVGGLYTYQAIPGGRRYRFVVTSETRQTIAAAVEALPGLTLRIGVAKRSDYGAVVVESVTQRPLGDGQQDTVIAGPGSDLAVRLLSPAVIHDPWLRPSSQLRDLTAAVKAALADAGCKVELELKDDDDTPNGQRHAATRSYRRDSWLASAGLPRPSLHGLAAGSVVVVRVAEGKITLAAKDAVELTGIGERRSEGLGQIVLGDPLASESTLTIESQPARIYQRQPRRSRTLAGRSASGVPDPLVTSLARSALRQAMARAATSLSHDEVTRRETWGLDPGQNKPTAAQLGSLRQLVSGVRTLDHRAEVRTWLGRLADTPNRRRKWPDKTLDAIRELVKDDSIERVWDQLGLGKPIRLQQYTVDQAIDNSLTNELWPEAFRALVLAITRGHRKAQARGEVQS